MPEANGLFAITAEELRRERELCLQQFDTALALGGFGPDTYPAWNAYVNRDVLAMFGDADWIGISSVAELYRTHAARRVERFEEATWRKAGNLFHYARAIGVVADAPDPERGRGWRLVDREVRWIVEGSGYRKRAVQVRGLPPAEQALQYKREATARKLADTLNRKARLEADEPIALEITRILHNDPDAMVPPFWVPQGFIPDWLPDTRIDASAGILRDAHHAAGLTRPKLKEWIEALRFFADGSRWRFNRRQQERAALPAHAEIPAEDDAALEALL